MSHTVFISYSQKDRATCVRLAKGLSELGINVRRDEISIEPGASLEESIRDLINTSDVTICLISTDSLRSLWVIWEIGNLTEESQDGQFLPAYLDKELMRTEVVSEIQP